MIPIHLRLSGFLSYRDPAEIDFTTFGLACISGHNGAGKSSLLDAITWALFGQARRRDDSLVHAHPTVQAAEVVFTFCCEENTYRVIRVLPRGKALRLEFQILDRGPRAVDRPPSTVDGPGTWRPLTERTVRETQARIESALRLDYETFVNASFFLQGRADQFTQQTPGRRKEILGSILGLEVWDVYKERAAERRKALEGDLAAVDGRVAEIEAELAEEDDRKAHLAELEGQLRQKAASRTQQETVLGGIKRNAASLAQQRQLVEKLADVLARSQANLSALETRLAGRQAERLSFADLLGRAAEVEAAYAAWQAARAEVARLDGVAAAFREHDETRQPLLRAIESEHARLEEEQRQLRSDEEAIRAQQSSVSEIQADLEAARAALAEAEATLARRAEVDARAVAGRERQAELRVENERLKAEMDTVKKRLDKLKEAEGAVCPLCGQELSPEHRRSTIAGIESDGKEMGDRWRANKSEMESLAGEIAELDAQASIFALTEATRLAQAASVSQLAERLEGLQRAEKEWKSTGARCLAEVTKSLAAGTFAAEARKQLAKVDRELAAIGYDVAAHDAARRAEMEARSAEEQYRRLEAARSALKPLEDEIASLQAQIVNLKSEIASQQSEHDEAAASLAAAESQAPDLESAERLLLDLQQEENVLNQEVGAARQKVAVLDDLRRRLEKLADERAGLALSIGRHKILERAFGRDGVPALLIEQALPEIESKANELLDRLSDGGMSVRFVTQAGYKDKKREDLRETLDIQISDGAGERAYELFSGGESFRVNFAIRLALSKVLAGRKGARLQTLVIDEGFGSQDAQGRQRLIEAINAVRGDFACVLIITHMDELKDAFPTRIEVEKVGGSSVVKVL